MRPHKFSDPTGNNYCFECGLSENHPEAYHYPLTLDQQLEFLQQSIDCGHEGQAADEAKQIVRYCRSTLMDWNEGVVTVKFGNGGIPY